MRKTVRKKLKKVVFAVLCGSLLFAKAEYAAAATEAVYEYDEERGEGNVYRGVVTTYGLNVRSAAGKDNPQVKVDGTNVVLDKDDEVAILDQEVNNGQVWYKVSFKRNDTVIVGYIHSSYVNLTVDVVQPIATPTPVPTPTPIPTATPIPTPTEAAPTATPTQAPGEGEDGGNGGGLVAILVVVAIAAAALVALWYIKKRNDDMKGNETSEKLDNLKNVPVSGGPLSADGTPIPVMKRREQPVQDTYEEARRQPVERQDEASLLADKERARLMNEEMIRQRRNGEGNDEAELREIAETLKEKEVLREEIDRLRIGDMVYHEYFGKGIVRDNSDVKVIEISFGQDVRFLNKASCAAKRLLRKL